MKATGVVRRIDELGRIVIPKEIRRTLKIREGTPLEIYSGDNGELLLKKYSPITELSELAKDICKSIAVCTQKSVILTNMETVISFAGQQTTSLSNQKIDSTLEKLINSRQAKIISQQENKSMLLYDYKISTYIVCPIICAGDVFGSIIMFDTNKGVSECDLIISKSFADFFATQIG